RALYFSLGVSSKVSGKRSHTHSTPPPTPGVGFLTKRVRRRFGRRSHTHQTPPPASGVGFLNGRVHKRPWASTPLFSILLPPYWAWAYLGYFVKLPMTFGTPPFL
ncbi:hypothetical protein A2U01_0040647, partial [Trifolium medium]|nr:hypothetical protein [Trifolium medium]